MIAAVAVYVVVAVLTSRRPFDLERMLHRGKYAVEAKADKPAVLPFRERLRLRNLLHFDDNFTFRDKLIAGGIFWWSIALVVINVVALVWNGFDRWPAAWWGDYWMATFIAVPFVVAVGTLVWFTVGGVRDMRDFFTALRTQVRDHRDDGRVVAGHNLADEPPPKRAGADVVPTSTLV
jgi:SSS family solute:Na+ symporter